jgi:hypothetical protein
MARRRVPNIPSGDVFAEERAGDVRAVAAGDRVVIVGHGDVLDHLSTGRIRHD